MYSVVGCCTFRAGSAPQDSKGRANVCKSLRKYNCGSWRITIEVNGFVLWRDKPINIMKNAIKFSDSARKLNGEVNPTLYFFTHFSSRPLTRKPLSFIHTHMGHPDNRHLRRAWRNKLSTPHMTVGVCVHLLHLPAPKSPRSSFSRQRCTFVCRILCYKQIKLVPHRLPPLYPYNIFYFPSFTSFLRVCQTLHFYLLCRFTRCCTKQSRRFPPPCPGIKLPCFHLLPRLNCWAMFHWLLWHSCWRLRNASCKMRRVKQIEKCCTWLERFK